MSAEKRPHGAADPTNQIDRCDLTGCGCDCPIARHSVVVRDDQFTSRCLDCRCPGYVTPMPFPEPTEDAARLYR
jgi:hypothetical protein